MPSILPYAALIFDCDGTLVHTGDLHFEAMHGALRRQAGTIERDWYRARGGLSRVELIRQLEERNGCGFDGPKLVSDSVSFTVERAALTMLNHAVAHIARHFAGRVPIAVASNAEEPVVHAILNAHGLMPVFDAVITIDDVENAKPAPDMFLRAAQNLGVAPQAALVFEDSGQGITAATAAGMAVLDVRDPVALEGFLSTYIAAR